MLLNKRQTLKTNRIYQIPIILASQSPRRIELMQQAGFRFTTLIPEKFDEIYPLSLQREEIPLYLARQKADVFLRSTTIPDDTIVITADTIVWLGEQALGKPADRPEAIKMLEALSGNMHHVYTGVCLTTNRQQSVFFAESKVFFRPLTDDEIEYYVDNFNPYDKAGAYGIQEWIGIVGVEKIEGSYENVMGLPIEKLYCELRNFIG